MFASVLRYCRAVSFSSIPGWPKGIHLQFIDEGNKVGDACVWHPCGSEKFCHNQITRPYYLEAIKLYAGFFIYSEAAFEMRPVVLPKANCQRFVISKATLLEEGESLQVVILQPAVVLDTCHAEPLLICLRPFFLNPLPERIKIREKRIASWFE